MEAKVAFVGFLDRPRLKQLFSTHNVLAFPSQFEEPFGISQVEAMAAGMVVVSSGTGGASEVVEDEVSGLLVPAGSSAALAAALAGLREDDERWQVLAEAGRERARKVFDIRRSVDQIEETFARLLAEHGRGG
jgi:glycosyltransferase involved in cell wall biosynthesis